MSLRKKDWKYILLFIGLSIATILYNIFDKEVILVLRYFFQFKQLNFIAGSISTIITIVYKIKTKKYLVTDSMSFIDFKLPIEDMLSFVSNPITIVCSLSLAKGLFLQETGKEQFFPLFNGIDRMFLAIITAYLLFISIMQLSKHFRVIINKDESDSAVPQAISEATFQEQK